MTRRIFQPLSLSLGDDDAQALLPMHRSSLFGAAELTYGGISGSTFFMVFGAPAAILGGLGTVLLQGEKRPEEQTEQG